MGNGRVYCYFDEALSQAKTIQEAHYYAFGLPIQKLSPNFEAAVGVEGNNYQYNGKELNEDFGLHWMDYGARWYDPQINRWGQIDPLAEHEMQIDKSPYAYAWNNPIKYDDPDGKCPKCLKALAKTLVKSIAKGKFDLGEGYDFVDAGTTILDPNASAIDKGVAVFDILSPVS